MPGRLAIYDDTYFLQKIGNHIGNFTNNVKQLTKNYNIPPTTYIPVFLNNLNYTYAHFGLIPSWAKDKKNININARSETINEKVTFKNSYKYKRCLIPINGWYEWIKKDNISIPYFLTSKDKLNDNIVCAGIYDEWYDNDLDKVILSIALITKEPNRIVKPIHDRMPTIIDKNDWKTWLNNNSTKEQLENIFNKDTDILKAVEVSTFVNKISNNTKECISSDYKIQEKPKQYIQTSLF